MGIDIQCGIGLGVTKQSCNSARIHALGNEQTGVGIWHRLWVMPYFPLEQNSLFVQLFFALTGREFFRWMYRFLCSFQPVPFVIVAAGYYDEITVLPSFSDACHFDHSFVCIDTKDTNLCDTKLSPNPTKNGHDTCAKRAKHQKFANITNSEDPPKRKNPHCGCAGQTKKPGALPGEC